MDERTLTALTGSIAKWEAIVAGTGKDDGSNNCTLCIAFDGCAGCPVADAVEMDSCELTPYIRWHDHHIYAHGLRRFPFGNECPECARLAQAELDFLKSLLPVQAVEAGTADTAADGIGAKRESPVAAGDASNISQES